MGLGRPRHISQSQKEVLQIGWGHLKGSGANLRRTQSPKREEFEQRNDMMNYDAKNKEFQLLCGEGMREIQNH